MANLNAPLGLRAIRHRNGAPYNGAAQPMWISGSYATNLFVGDPVVKVAAGSNPTQQIVPGVGVKQPGTMPAVERATAGATNKITGVIVGFAANADNLSRQYSPANTEGIAFVADDPDLIFQIQSDGTLSASSVGQNANLTYAVSGSTASGRSGAQLLASSVGADATFQLLIMRSIDMPNNDVTLANATFEVLINQHTENQGASGIVGV